MTVFPRLSPHCLNAAHPAHARTDTLLAPLPALCRAWSLGRSTFSTFLVGSLRPKSSSPSSPVTSGPAALSDPLPPRLRTNTPASAAQRQLAALPMAKRGVVTNGYDSRANEPLVDVSEEERLLQAFSLISNIDKAWCRPSPSSPGQAPAPKGGKAAQSGKVALDIMVQMSQRNLPGNKVRKYISHAHIPEPQGDLSTFHWSPFPTELQGVAAVSPSPSGTRLLVVRNGDDKQGADDKAKAVHLEIWGAGRLLKEIFVPPTVHRSVYTDGTFQCFSWTEDETSVAYVAEEPSKKQQTLGKVLTEHSLVAPSPAPAGRGRYSGAKSQPQEPKAEEAGGPGTWQAKGEWQSDWGEQYTGKGKPLLFVLSIPEGKVEAVEGIPDDLSVGQAVWAPPPRTAKPSGPGAAAAGSTGSQTALVFVGWSSLASNFPTTRQLGLIYCFNRPCALYAVRSPAAGGGSLVKLTPKISSAMFPQFSPDGSLLVFLSSQAATESGVHCATNSLHSLRWPGDIPAPVPARGTAKGAAPADVATVDLPIQTVVDVTPRPEEAAGFPGLYCMSVARQPWLADGRTLLLTTAWRSTQTIIAVHVETGRLSRLTPEGPISWNLLDVQGNAVVAGASTPACPTKLMLGRMNAGFFKQEGWLWSEISTPHVEYAEEVESSLKTTEFEVLTIVPSAPSLADVTTEGAKLPFEAIFVRRSMETPQAPGAAAGGAAPGKAPAPAGPPPPLVVVPHGGPHAVSSTTFLMPYAYLCSLGFAVLHVNYRGSLGFGEEALQSLPGKIGRQDVDDVLEAVSKVVELGYVDSSRVAVVGGSHGGFLTAHLIGQEPDRFQTGVLRNPVCNLATMIGTSDIPDWVFVETFGAKGVSAYTEVPTAADLDAFLAASPISNAHKIKVPTLFLLGGSDRRVPPSNGLQLAQALKTQGLETKVILFPEDAHPIDKPQSEFEGWLEIASWLKTYV